MCQRLTIQYLELKKSIRQRIMTAAERFGFLFYTHIRKINTKRLHKFGFYSIHHRNSIDQGSATFDRRSHVNGFHHLLVISP